MTQSELEAAALRQPGAIHRDTGIKFQCPECRAEGHDTHRDNARLARDGTWGCAVAPKGSPLGSAHWRAIRDALVAAATTNGSSPATAKAGHEQTRTTDETNPWDAAQTISEYLAGSDQGGDFIDPERRLLCRGLVTETFSPRGIGKSIIMLAFVDRFIRAGVRVLLIDRDNPKSVVTKRLRGFGMTDLTGLKIIGRQKAPPLTDRAAWAAFPIGEYDLVVIDSLNASSEGIDERDTGKSSLMLAPILDLARHEKEPAVWLLGNCVRTGAHSRGNGVTEDRADIIYELRDATDFTPSGRKPWPEELPPAGADQWAARSGRRKGRKCYRVAFVNTKFRVDEEPEPFILEVRHDTTPWRVDDVTADVLQAAEQVRREAHEAQQDTEQKALVAFVRALREAPMNQTAAERFLVAEGCHRSRARHLLKEGVGDRFVRRQVKGRGGAAGTGTLLYEAAEGG